MTLSPTVQRETVFEQRELANGLTVLVEERRAVPVAAVNLWYNVGSRHERHDQRGLAHLFEHLMFQGSAQVKAGEHAAVLEQVGARFNATTSFDRTNYFETVPIHALPTALWLEADRMATLRDALSQGQFEAQRDVVKNERLQTIVEVPYGEWMLHLMAALLPESNPYAILPIGRMEHLDASTLEDLRAFFDLHYAPGNAVLSIVGDVDAEEAFTLAEAYFGAIPAGPLPPHDDVPALPPLQPGDHRTTIEDDVPYTAVYRSWRAPAMTDEAFPALEIAALVLGGGNDSRLRRGLVREQQIALDVQTHVMGLASGNSAFFVNAYVSEGADADAVIAAVDVELQRLIAEGITEDEFTTALARRERDTIESMASVAGRSDLLSMAHTIYGDAAQADEIMTRLRDVTPEAVREAAATWLRPDTCATVVYQPANATEVQS